MSRPTRAKETVEGHDAEHIAKSTGSPVMRENIELPVPCPEQFSGLSPPGR
jgi:hypothetical protein